MTVGRGVTGVSSEPLNPNNLAPRPDFALGGVTISPSMRSIKGASGQAVVEPRIMQVLVAMAEAPGRLVTRDDLLSRCWNGTVVGDDSLNRAIGGLRRALNTATDNGLRVETVPGSGYALLVADNSELTAHAIDEGWQSWKLGAPFVDHGALAALRAAAAATPQQAEVQGMLALILRNGAEYADLDLCSQLVRECEGAAARALAIDPTQSHARAALIGLPPLFGDWIERRRKLIGALEESPDNIVAAHDLCMLEMATGRPSEAAAIGSRLIAIEPLAATLHYKLNYQLWSTGQLTAMDRIGDRGMTLWPRHPAIWFARLWSLAFTGRVRQAIQQLGDTAARPDLPGPALVTLEVTLAALADPGDAARHAQAVERNLLSAEQGPAQGLAAVIHLAGLGEVEAALRVADGYLLRSGPVSVGLHKTVSDPSVTDQHRRVTQMLFLPVTSALREHPRFLPLCEQMGLADYWDATGVIPDFLARSE
ncbi:hypothetical protein CDQ92_08465 [Sphingopyxis bauzanensis]|uniref:OmpR/PhoB-type domain-containing protein n=1 Tax=Sphingopyxis bauzanensis TaxID=651663 RepID=A0A246JVK7_9SPHN|nr:hypothetical protein CDQ92_08465 [Sphingopyxis bauzanensis]GGJ40974.1 hypothetical protein GCM10011393_08940 [Sphingopyxis bauzanensis]